MSLVAAMWQTFGLPPRYWACIVTWQAGTWMVNPCILQQMLERQKHERVAEGESLCDFILRHYGADAVALVERGIKGEAVQA